MCQGAAAEKAQAKAYEHQLEVAEVEQRGKNIVTKVKQTDYLKNKDAINLAFSRRKADVDYKVATIIRNALKENETLARKFAGIQKQPTAGRSNRFGKKETRAWLHQKGANRARLEHQTGESAQIAMRSARYEAQGRHNQALTKLGIPPSPTIAPPEPVFKGLGERLTDVGIKALSIGTSFAGAGGFGKVAGSKGTNASLFDVFNPKVSREGGIF